MSEAARVVLYGAEWCGDCRRSKRFLDSNTVEYTYIDVEADESASDKVIAINGGVRSIPCHSIIFWQIYYCCNFLLCFSNSTS